MMGRKWRVVIAIVGSSAALICLLGNVSHTRIQEYFNAPQQGTNSPPKCPPIISTRSLIPSEETLLRMSEAEVEELYYTYAENMDVLCVNKVRLGNSNDGGWDVCDDPDYRPQPPCLVYSFGINNDFTFDDTVSSKYGCEVHSFDPSMKQGDYKRSERVFFHQVGLSNEDKVDSKGWTMKTLSSIKAQLNHTKVSSGHSHALQYTADDGVSRNSYDRCYLKLYRQNINILKMDIENDEYKALPDIVASGQLHQVDQLLFEIHLDFKDKTTAKNRMAHGLEIFRDLYDLGFLAFYAHRNDACTQKSPITGRSRTVCNEIFMLRVS